MVNDWNPDTLKKCQLDDPDIGPALGWLEAGSRPDWKESNPQVQRCDRCGNNLSHWLH